MFTTPPRPVDVGALFPELVPLARTATRLHPRRGTPVARESSVAGPLMWAEGEPWPQCRLPHSESPRIQVPRDHPPLVPVVQLLAADVPDVVFPPGTDVMQLLWCPYEHRDLPGQEEYYFGPAPELRWRNSQELTGAADFPAGNHPANGWVLHPCVLHPEQVTEYPADPDLPTPVLDALMAWEEQADERGEPEYTYHGDLSTAPGLKAGGWPYWPDSERPTTCACGADTDLLLAVPYGERAEDSWTPLEEQHVTTLPADDRAFHEPTGYTASEYQLQVFLCRTDRHHPPLLVIE